MTDPVRQIILSAAEHARFGAPLDSAVRERILSGDPTLTIERLDLDSVAWLEFSISIAIQIKEDLPQAVAEPMTYVHELETWLRSRVEGDALAAE